MSFVCLSSANCLWAFLCIIFRRGFPLGRRHADQFDAVRGVWSEHWKADPHPFNLCNNADSTQVLWSTMARSVLSGTCPVWSWPTCCSSLPLGAMLNFQWPVWENESDNTKFNTPAPHSHLRPCNTNASHDTEEEKWLIGPSLDIFTHVLTCLLRALTLV